MTATTIFANDAVYAHTAAGTPVVVVRVQYLMQPYSEKLSAQAISPATGCPSYLLAAPGTTDNNVRRTVYGIGRLTGRRQSATKTAAATVEVEVIDYSGNSTEEARELIAAM